MALPMKIDLLGVCWVILGVITMLGFIGLVEAKVLKVWIRGWQRSKIILPSSEKIITEQATEKRKEEGYD